MTRCFRAASAVPGSSTSRFARVASTIPCGSRSESTALSTVLPGNSDGARTRPDRDRQRRPRAGGGAASSPCGTRLRAPTSSESQTSATQRCRVVPRMQFRLSCCDLVLEEEVTEPVTPTNRAEVSRAAPARRGVGRRCKESARGSAHDCLRFAVNNDGLSVAQCFERDVLIDVMRHQLANGGRLMRRWLSPATSPLSREQAVMFKRPYTEGPGGGTSRDRLCLQLPTTRQRPSLRGYRRRHARKRHLEMRSRPQHRPRDHPQRTR